MGTLKIYQLKSGDENRYRRWMNYDSLRKMGEIPRIENYEEVYSKQLLDNPTPEQVYLRFNQTRPADFTGHSLSPSDIIVFQSEAETIALYVDNVDYTRLPDLEKELAAAEKAHRICLEIYQMRGDLQNHEQIQLRDYQKVKFLDRTELPAAGIALRPFYTIKPSAFKDYPLSEGDVIAIREDDKAVGAFLVKDGAFARLGANFEQQLREKYEREKSETERLESAQLPPNDSSRVDNYKLFYGGNAVQDRAAYDFQKMTGWNMAWGSDSNGLNGDTWIVYRSISDLPKPLQHLIPSLVHEITDTAQKVLPVSEVVGFLRYLDSGEKVDFRNADAYIAAYKEDLYDYGPNGVRAVTLTKDLGVHYEIEKLRVGEFGEKLPDKETWIKNHSNSAQNYCMEHQQQPDMENDGLDL